MQKSAKVRIFNYISNFAKSYKELPQRYYSSSTDVTKREEFYKFVRNLPPENNIGSISLSKNEETHTAVVCIENLTFMNAMTGKMMLDFEEITEDLSKWKNGKAVFLIGKNNQFCSGGDLKNFMNHLKTPELGALMACYMHGVMRKFSSLTLSTVAVIEGQTLGGGAEVATACDYRIIGNSAKIGFVQTRLAISPGWGGATRLGCIVGKRRATELLTSGRLLNAEQAVGMKLADDVFDQEKGDPLPWAMDWLKAKGLLSSSPKITQGVCNVLKNDDNLEESYRRERELFASVWQSEDHKEALSKNIKHKK